MSNLLPTFITSTLSSGVNGIACVLVEDVFMDVYLTCCKSSGLQQKTLTFIIRSIGEAFLDFRNVCFEWTCVDGHDNLGKQNLVTKATTLFFGHWMVHCS